MTPAFAAANRLAEAGTTDAGPTHPISNSAFLRAVYGSLREDYGWTTSFDADPGDASPGVWAGSPWSGNEGQCALIDRRGAANNYYSVGVMYARGGEKRRSKDVFGRLAVLLADDVTAAGLNDLVGGYSYALETSKENYQVGVILDPADPDTRNADLIDAVLHAMGASGHVEADSSGNNPVRYARLPVGSNTKTRPTGAFKTRLLSCDLASVYSLADAVAAFGLDLDDIRGRTHQARATPGGKAGTGDAAQLYKDIIAPNLEERSYHDALLKLTAGMVASKMNPGAVVNYARSLMTASKPTVEGPEMDRWQARYDEIPRMVQGAGKYSPDGAEEAIGTIGAIGNAVSGDWDAPDLSLLEGPAIPAPAFPAEILGSYWADWCATAAKGANAPLDYTAMALLTVTAALIGNARRVAPTPAWEEPAILWTVLVGVPSSGKSPALDPLTAIVVAFEADMARDFEQTLHKYTADLEMATQKKEYWKTQVKDAVKAFKEAPILPIDAQEPLPPQRPRIMIADTTMEAAADIAAANPKGLVLIRDELGAWWRGFNNYGGDGERQFWLHAYGARPHTVDRKKLGRPVNIPRLSVSVLGGTQPDVLAQLLAGEEDGFVARFLFCFPDPVSGFVLSNHPIDLGGARTALQRLRGLPLVEDGQSDPRPFICTLAPDAAVAFERWWGECRTEATHHAGVYGAWLGKAGGFILRLALALEHLRWCATPFANSANSANSFPTLVSLDALQSAIRLIDDWAVPMARRAFGTAAISHEEADATALARWLKRNGCRKFNSRQLRRQSTGPSGRLAKTAHMDASCKRLEDAGLIRHAPSRAGDKPGRTRLDYDVNPKLLEC